MEQKNVMMFILAAGVFGILNTEMGFIGIASFLPSRVLCDGFFCGGSFGQARRSAQGSSQNQCRRICGDGGGRTRQQLFGRADFP